MFWLNQPKCPSVGDWAHPYDRAHAATEQSDNQGTESRKQMRGRFSGTVFQLVNEERIVLEHSHFVTANEIMDLDHDCQGLLTSRLPISDVKLKVFLKCVIIGFVIKKNFFLTLIHF